MISLHAPISLPPLTPPEFSVKWHDTEYWTSIAQNVLRALGLSPAKLERPRRGSTVVFNCGDYFLKLYPGFEYDQYQSEVLTLPHLSGRLPVPTPSLIATGPLENGWNYALISRLEGEVVEDVWPEFSESEKRLFMADLGTLVRSVQSLDAIHYPDRESSWSEFIDDQQAGALARHTSRKLPEHLLQELTVYLAEHVAPVRDVLAPVLLTGEYTPDNLLAAKTKDGWRLSGMFDFGDMMMGLADYDLLGPTEFFAAGSADLQRPFFSAYYNREFAMTDDLRHRLMTLSLLHRFSNLPAQVVMSGWQEAPTFDVLAKMIWP